MNTLLERGKAAQMKDVREMSAIKRESLIHPPDYACSSVVGGIYNLSQPVKDTLTAPTLTR